MSHRILLLCAAVMLLPCGALAQDQQVQGPRKVTSDSVEITITKVRLQVTNSNLDFSGSSAPTLMPTGSTRAKVWFVLGFMLNSCRVKRFKRIDSGTEPTGSTLNFITFRCHYKAAEFRSAVRDMMD